MKAYYIEKINRFGPGFDKYHIYGVDDDGKVILVSVYKNLGDAEAYKIELEKFIKADK